MYQGSNGMEPYGRTTADLVNAGAVTLYVARYITFVGSSKKKAAAAREKITSEFPGVSDAVLHEIETMAFKSLNSTTKYAD